MGLTCFILFCQLVVLVSADVLVDYAAKSLKELPNWIEENVDDVFTFTHPYASQIHGSFLGGEIKPGQVTANGMKTLRLLDKPAISGSLFTGRLDIDLILTVDLKLSGTYEASGSVFPYAEDIKFSSSGTWSADTNIVMTQQYHISMNASANGTMNMDTKSLSKYKQETSFSNLNIENFLNDHTEQWYYAIIKEGFGRVLESHTLLALSNESIDLFEGFFKKIFESVNYSDIGGS